MNEPDDDAIPPMMRGIAKAPEPPAELRHRVIASLRAEGLIAGPRRTTRWPWPVTVAAAAACLAAGIFIGGRRPRAIEVPRFALLLYDSAGTTHRDASVAAHRAWATELARAGRAVSGEAFAPEAHELVDSSRTGGAAQDQLSGFFIVSAANAADAIAVAATSPHYQQHGRIVVRPIMPTGGAR